VATVLGERDCLRPHVTSMAEAREMRRLYEAGMTIRQVAAATGRSMTTVGYCLRVLDVQCRRPPVSEDEAADIIALYASRLSMSEVAERVGRSIASVQRTLRRHGVRINRPGRNIRPTPVRTPHHRVEAILDAYRATRSQRETSRLLGMSQSTVRYHLLRAGEPLVSRSEVGRMAASPRRLSPEREALICEMYSGGSPFPEIEASAGVCRGTITNVVKRCGVPLRPKADAVRRSWATRRELVPTG
jgi:transposase-like protein